MAAADGKLLVDCGPHPHRRALISWGAVSSLFWPLTIGAMAVASGHPRVWAFAALVLAGAVGVYAVLIAMAVRNRVRLFEGGISTGWRFIPWYRVGTCRLRDGVLEVTVPSKPYVWWWDAEVLEYAIPEPVREQVRAVIADHAA